MFEKLKSYFNKKYTTISLYVIVTLLIIFVLAYTTTRIGDIVGYIGGILSYIGTLLTPVIIGIIIAYVLSPLVDLVENLYKRANLFKPEKEKRYRSLAVLSSFLLILFIIFLLLGIFIFSITKQISSIRIEKLTVIISSYISSFSESIKGIEDKLTYFNVQSGSVNQYITQLSSMLSGRLGDFANNLTVNALNITKYISNTIFGIIVSIYLLLEKDVFIQYLNMVSKAMLSDNVQKKLKDYWKDIDSIFSGYIRGQVLDAIFMSVVLSISLSIIGIKFGSLIGVLAGLCNLIPYFGPIVAFVGTIFFGLLNAQYSKVVIAIIVLFILQQVDGNIVGPKIMSDGVALKPVFILIAVIIGSQVGGVVGMVLAVPVAALIKLFIKRYVDKKLMAKDEFSKLNNGL